MLGDQQSQKNDDDKLDDVEIEYVAQPVDAESLKSMDGMKNVDESVLEQFTNIFKHFSVGNADEEEVRLLSAAFGL